MTGERYPAPSYAATVWIGSEGKLTVCLPPLPGRDKSHTILVPCDEFGMKALQQLLAARQQGYDAQDRALRSYIGTRGSMTQYNLDEMIKAMKVTRIEPKKDGSKVVSIEELGL